MTRQPPSGGPAAIICEACFSRVRDADAAARLAGVPSAPPGAECFGCGTASGGATRVITHPDVELPFCLACIEASKERERALERGRAVPQDVVPEEVLAGVLYIGAKEAQANRATLASLGITRVLVCCDSLPAYHAPGAASGLTYHRLPLADSLAQGLRAYLPSALAFIAQGAARGERTLVHCNAGVSRSGAVAVEALRRAAGLPLAGALAAAKAVRPLITPNPNFMRQLAEMPEGGGAVAAAAARRPGGVSFGQLLGMSDGLTFDLAGRGLAAFKYVPYGPVAAVTPYLLRRGEENADLLTSNVGKEIEDLEAELRQRLLPPWLFTDGKAQ